MEDIKTYSVAKPATLDRQSALKMLQSLAVMISGHASMVSTINKLSGIEDVFAKDYPFHVDFNELECNIRQWSLSLLDGINEMLHEGDKFTEADLLRMVSTVDKWGEKLN